MVDNSEIPLINTLIVGSALTIILTWLNMLGKTSTILLILITGILINLGYWWINVNKESKESGLHIEYTQINQKLGLYLFIISEVLFFITFFWTLLHSALIVNEEVGGEWPPKGIDIIEWYQVPLVNTILLLSSGIAITWVHKGLNIENKTEYNKSMNLTIILGLIFLYVQYTEYIESVNSIADSIYSNTFYLTTGFHGIHVIIGVTLLIVTYIRLVKINYTNTHNMGFTYATVYWHFVDVIWLILIVLVYIWGS